MNHNLSETIIVGHRNPDLDSICSAYALAELKHHQGDSQVTPVIAGMPGARAEYVFKRFQAPLPVSRGDVYPTVGELVDSETPFVNKGDSLFAAIKLLEMNKAQRLPILDGEYKYCGMLSLFSLLSDLLQISGNGAAGGLTGRKVTSSIQLISQVLNAEQLSLHKEKDVQDFEVYVAAMNVESFKEHIPYRQADALAIIVGDRSDIHLMGIGIGVRLMIVTGSRKVDRVILKAARERGVSIIKTPFDSATVVRRLKFSCPVESMAQTDVETFRNDQRVCDIRRRIFENHEDVFPVLDKEQKLLGTFTKSDLGTVQPIKVVMVDHNEYDQGIDGIEEVPVIEVVDHHRLNMPPTDYPIKITCDAVGSTCTLVSEMYRNSGLEPSPGTAGILLSGIITDTLLLRSPTSTERDKRAIEYLQNLAGVEADVLMREIFDVGSVIVRSTPREILTADKKNFTAGRFNFAVAQVEEASFDQFRLREEEINAELQKILSEENLDLFALLVTNVVSEDSLLLAAAPDAMLEQLPYRRIKPHLYDLPGILSRKKQLLPQLLKFFGKME